MAQRIRTSIRSSFDPTRVRIEELKTWTYGQVMTRYGIGALPESQMRLFCELWKRRHGFYPTEAHWNVPMSRNHVSG